MFTEYSLLEKIGVAAAGLVLTGLCGGGMFFIVVKFIVLNYFKNIDKKQEATFKRIDELRDEWRSWKSEEWRDYKRDIALAIKEGKDSIKELFGRTDNWKEVEKTVEFCDDKNKAVKP